MDLRPDLIHIAGLILIASAAAVLYLAMVIDMTRRALCFIPRHRRTFATSVWVTLAATLWPLWMLIELASRAWDKVTTK